MEFFANTDIGRKRSANQDNYCTHKFAEHALLCAVFDGMGGHAGGETASKIARDRFLITITDALSDKDTDTKHSGNGSKRRKHSHLRYIGTVRAADGYGNYLRRNTDKR